MVGFYQETVSTSLRKIKIRLHQMKTQNYMKTLSQMTDIFAHRNEKGYNQDPCCNAGSLEGRRHRSVKETLIAFT